MRTLSTLSAAVLMAALLPAQQPAQQPSQPADAAVAEAPLAPLDFAKVDRTIDKLPDLSEHPRYGLLLFGDRCEQRVWAVLDRSPAGKTYDLLYFDLDGDGDLTAPGERFAGAARNQQDDADCEFVIGDYRPPGAAVAHQDFRIKWTKKSVRFTMLWRGDKVSYGGYGPSHDTYASFGDSPKTAPIYVPGHDRPLEFERWIAEPLKRGGSTDFKVFLGNRGDRTGAFAAVDDEFLPEGEYVVVTLRYRDSKGKEQQDRWELRQRC